MPVISPARSWACPRAGTDDTLALLRSGYDYPTSRRRSTACRVRLLGRKALLVGGRAGAELFYDQSLIRRRGAIPAPLKNTLFGKGAVHGLDDEEHRTRKAIFVDLLGDDAAKEIARRAELVWQHELAAWRDGTTLSVFDTAVQVHGRAVCGWAGVPAEDVDDGVLRDLVAMVDGFGTVGPRFLAARRARRRADRWARAMIERVRRDPSSAPGESALAAFALGDARGVRLPIEVAAVELLNVLRPTVAVAYFVAFAVEAQREDLTLRGDCATGVDELLEQFAHEVRRRYPFVPMLGGRARHSFTFQGLRVRAGTPVLLDVWGTLQQPELWPEPERFDINRFADGLPPDRWSYVPHGGGDIATGHRCPGERVAVELIKIAARVFSTTQYEVPPQDLRVPMNRVPARPRSGVLLLRCPT